MSRLGNIRRREGDLDEALRMNEEAVKALRGIGDRGGVAMALFNLGLVLFDRGDLARSRSVFEEALAIRRQQHDKNNTAQAVAGLARIALAQDRLSDAAALISESIALRQELGENIALAQSKMIYSAILLEQNNAAAAEKAAREAAATFHGASAWSLEGEAAVILSRAQLAGGDAAGARTTVSSSEKILAASEDARLRLWRDGTLGRVLSALHRNDKAATILDRALSEARRLGLAAVAFDIQLAQLEAGQAPAQLAADAQQAGFLLIARKARR
jgi:tetratricopeptide (TPR) repeat protein